MDYFPALCVNYYELKFFFREFFKPFSFSVVTAISEKSQDKLKNSRCRPAEFIGLKIIELATRPDRADTRGYNNFWMNNARRFHTIDDTPPF